MVNQKSEKMLESWSLPNLPLLVLHVPPNTKRRCTFGTTLGAFLPFMFLKSHVKHFLRDEKLRVDAAGFLINLCADTILKRVEVAGWGQISQMISPFSHL